MHIKTKGFTLVELILVLTISTILLVIAIPSLTSVSTSIRVDANIRTIQQTLYFARNQAISYGQTVTICPLINGDCSDNWQQGLVIFTDSGNRNQLDSVDKVLKQTGSFNSTDTVSYNRKSIRFTPDGLAVGTNGTLKYCPPAQSQVDAKALIISNAGRVRVSNDTTISCL